MKTLSLIILALFCTISVIAQPWIGPVPGNIYYNQGNVGIGTNSPFEKLTIAGGHGDTKLRLFSTGNGSDQPSNLSLWASEPGVTYYGTGIGFNVKGSPYYGRIDNSRGSSYVRFLPGETKFEFQNGSGSPINDVLVIKESGNIGIGMNNPNSKVVISDEYGTMSINSGGIGFNRNVKDGQIFNTSVSAWQLQTRDDRFTLEGYNGAAHDLFTVLKNGDVGMGTIAPQYKLDVIGTIRAKEIKVDLNGADFVFDKEYKLMPLSELETFINEQKHLPDVATAKEMQEKGTDLGDLNSKLLQKIEELTLYAIVQNKSIKEQVKKNEELAKKIEVLEKAVNNLISK